MNILKISDFTWQKHGKYRNAKHVRVLLVPMSTKKIDHEVAELHLYTC